MSVYAERPWLSLYRAGTAPGVSSPDASMLDVLRETVARGPDRVAIRYFDGSLTYAELDRRSDALAAYLRGRGFGDGQRLALYTQNDPAFVVGLLATWKCGGAAVCVNPMNKAGELTYLLTDSGATALLCLDELWTSVARDVVRSSTTSVGTVVVASALDDQTRDDARCLPGRGSPLDAAPEGVVSFADVCAGGAAEGREPAAPRSQDAAVLTYTSGTTGKPKGAINTHANLVFNARTYRDWMGLGEDDVVLGLAPLFHITGLVGHVSVALLTGAELVLAHRFDPQVMLDAMREHRPTFTVGAITAFNALASAEGVTKDDWSSFRAIYSGGAPIAPATTDRFRDLTGHYIHNIYGLTETTSPSHAVPLGVEAPVDPTSGALSVGVPVYDTVVRVLDESGAEVPAGEVGELATRGPQVVPGYWENPEATAENIPDGELRTGDVGFMTPEGWFFLVDRKKDMINASGYKVWPREVEDVLYGHPAIHEVAVVGVPDEYRGETVKAFVSLAPDAQVSPEDLVAWARERMATYKTPREIEIIDALPKTATGKILRRELRPR